jgi:uncharacterized membrane protein
LKDSDTIHIRIAQILRALEYVALSLILISFGLKSLKIEDAIYGVLAGIGLSIAAPISGIIAIAVFSWNSRNYRYLAASLLILLFFIIAVVASA